MVAVSVPLAFVALSPVVHFALPLLAFAGGVARSSLRGSRPAWDRAHW